MDGYGALSKTHSIHPALHTTTHIDAETARHAFTHALRTARRRRWFQRILGRRSSLYTRDDLAVSAVPVPQHGAGAEQVTLNRIVGSEGRAHEFDDRFAPLAEHTRERWQRVALAWLTGTTLPPVRLIQIDDQYIVRDGNHRISAARTFGATTIEAIVEQRFVSIAPAPEPCAIGGGSLAQAC